MGRIVKYNVFVRKDPPSGPVTALRKGDEAPEWAEALLGDHVFQEAGEGETPKRAARPLPTLPKKEEKKPEPTVAPELGAHVSKWRSFAAKIGIDVPKGTARDEIIEMVRDKNPDLIEED